jgi:predicted metal-dependent phosphoesterase TrpH
VKPDFHCHTSASDGSLTPTELIDRALAQSVTHLAITDHDTTAGYDQARAYADEQNLCLVTGTEISCQWRGHTIHVVGLGVDVSNATLQQGLQYNRVLRWKRALAIEDRFRHKKGWSLLPEILPEVGQGMIGRNHFAQMLVKKGHVRTQKQAFDRFLKKGKPMFVDVAWPSLAEITHWITTAGGIAVVAHPHLYKLTSNKLNQMLTEFVEAGGEGLEVVNQPRVCSEQFGMAQRAKKFGLYASMGSDFHRPEQHWRNLGWLQPLPIACRPIWEWLQMHSDQWHLDCVTSTTNV